MSAGTGGEASVLPIPMAGRFAVTSQVEGASGHCGLALSRLAANRKRQRAARAAQRPGLHLAAAGGLGVGAGPAYRGYGGYWAAPIVK